MSVSPGRSFCILLPALAVVVSTMSILGSPASDHFTQRVTLHGTNLTTTASLAGATVESSEPNHFSTGAPTRSVWWSWMAPNSGTILLSASQSDYAVPAIAVYTGNSLGTLTRLIRGAGEDLTQLSVTGGTTYQIVAADSDEVDGQIILTLQWFPPPPNDNYANAEILTSAPTSAFGWTLGATREQSEPSPNGHPAVWWQWTAPANGRATVRVTPVRSYASVAVYAASNFPSEVPLASYGDSVAPFTASANTRYYFAVYSRPEAAGPFTLDLSLSAFRFSSPASNASFYVPTQIGIELDVTPFDLPVSRIDLFANNTKLTTLHEPPWNLTWSDPPKGHYVLRAELFEPDGDIRRTTVSVAVRPDNDIFANRIFVPETEFVVSGDTTMASSEPDEPVHSPDGNGSVWWSWRSPSNGVLEVSVFSGQFVYAAVYRGETLSQLSQVARRDYPAPFYVPVRAGEIYHIAAATPTYWGTGFLMSGRFHLPPPNDGFANRQLITNNASTFIVSNLGASSEPGEPLHADTGVRHTLWWTWTAPSGGILRLSPSITEFPTVIAVYAGCSIEALTNLAQRSSTQSQPLIMRVQRGATYQIAVDAANEASRPFGEVHFEVHFSPTPSNDAFADRIALVGLPVVISADNAAATVELGEPGHGPAPALRSLWWSWTAPRSGRVGLISKDCVAAVYRGSTVSNLTLIARHDWPSNPRFIAEVGETYAIALDTPWEGREGPISLHMDDCLNDHFADRIRLSGTHIVVSNINVAATTEPGEPRHWDQLPVNTMWWTWRAPFSGTVTGLFRGDFGIFVSIYTGDSLTSLVSVANFPRASFPPTVAFQTVEGTEYQIVVSSTGGSGFFELTLGLNSFHLSSPSFGAVLRAGQDLTLALAPIVPELHGVVDELHFFARRLDFSSTNELLGSVSDPTETFARTLHVPGAYLFFAVATNRAGQVLRTEDTPVTLRPANDLFEHRIRLTGASIGLTAGVTDATIETNEPSTPFPWYVGSTWWSWTAPDSGPYIFFSDKYLLQVFTGGSLESLSRVATNLSRVVNVTAGTEYHVRLLTERGSDLSPATWQIVHMVAPPNDDFANRLELAGTDVSFIGSMFGATYEPGEPQVHIQEGVGSVWWTWTALDDGMLQVRKSASGGRIHLYRGGAFSNLVHVAELSEWTRAPVNNAVPYHIALVGGETQTNNLELRLILKRFPLNDDFDNSFSIAGTSATLSGSTELATREPAEPTPADGAPRGGSLWWSWTAPISAKVVLTLTNSQFDPFLEIFRGTNLHTLVSLYPDTTYYFFRKMYIFPAKAGETYHISVSGGGAVTVELSVPPQAANDHFTNALVLSGNHVHGVGHLLNATFEPGEPAHRGLPPVPSLWYSWTAPSIGRAAFSPLYASSVYTGTTLANLRAVPFGRDLNGGDVADFSTEPNTRYYIAVAPDYQPLEFAFDLQFHPSPANDQFANRVVIDGTSAEIRTAFRGATLESGFTLFNYNGDLWWTWRAPAPGTAELMRLASQYSVLFGVYSGNSISNLSLVTSGYYRASFTTVAGRWYQFRVAAWGGETNVLVGFNFINDPPALLQPLSQPNANSFTFTLHGSPGTTFLLQTSTNLIDWTSLGLHTFYGQRFQFVDEEAAGPMRFYRISHSR